ncbi:MAG: CRISPR-associated endonuclease Cas2 [Terriglobia bacterium]
MSSEEKTPCLVVYDVVEDRCRQRVSEACLDYGLERFQMSAFWGRLTATRRREMFLKLTELLGESAGRILVQPVSQDDVEKRLLLNQRPEEEDGRPPREWPEPGAPKSTVLKF